MTMSRSIYEEGYNNYERLGVHKLSHESDMKETDKNTGCLVSPLIYQVPHALLEGFWTKDMTVDYEDLTSMF